MFKSKQEAPPADDELGNYKRPARQRKLAGPHPDGRSRLIMKLNLYHRPARSGINVITSSSSSSSHLICCLTTFCCILIVTTTQVSQAAHNKQASLHIEPVGSQVQSPGFRASAIAPGRPPSQAAAAGDGTIEQFVALERTLSKRQIQTGADEVELSAADQHHHHDEPLALSSDAQEAAGEKAAATGSGAGSSSLRGKRTLYACEERQLAIECQLGESIQLIRANYGRFSIQICNEHGQLDWKVNCTSPDSFGIITRR